MIGSRIDAVKHGIENRGRETGNAAREAVRAESRGLTCQMEQRASLLSLKNIAQVSRLRYAPQQIEVEDAKCRWDAASRRCLWMGKSV